MATIKFMPMNKEFEAEEGETILDVALRNDVPMQHACGGMCACATCQVNVERGMENLTESLDEERERLEDSSDSVRPESRLGCQSVIKGDVVVFVVNQE